jgi:hypothetical protein
MRNTFPLAFLFLALLVWIPAEGLQAATVEDFNVTWTDFAKDSQDSMPTGNGDIGLNVWTESNGDVLFYIGKTDAWRDGQKVDLVKVGRVRLSLTPNPFAGGPGFSQTLKLRESEIVVTGGGSTLRIWVDANAPVVHVESQSVQPTTLKITLDPWRTPSDPKSTPDVILPNEKNRLAWYHHNEKLNNPAVVNLTFGGWIQGKNLISGEGQSLKSATAATNSRCEVSVLTATVQKPEEWIEQIQALASQATVADLEQARSEHQKWWAAFWDRSHIFLGGEPEAIKVTQGYTLQRYVTACAGRGGNAIKFNGTIFVTDFPGDTEKPKGATEAVPAPRTADFRAWGGQYWFQNTRPMYWPLLASGDYDLMRPMFRQFAQAVKNNASSVKEFYGHEGSYMAETAPHYGGIPNIKPGEAGSYTKHYFTPVLELSTMMLDYYEHTGDKALVKETLIPMISSGLTFFSQHFPRDPQGKLLLEPDNSIEMYWIVKNPLPDIAGLHWVLDHLLALSEDLVDAPTRAQWKKLQGELPPIPLGEKGGKRVLLPYSADQPEAPKHNSENPELYAVYPFRHYGVGKPDLDVALNTYDIRLNKRTGCWHQDPVDEALLGLADAAQKDVTANLTRKDPRLKFPAFWDKGHDFAPDEDNGGHGQLALQWMLMQCEGKTIRLLPAWPKNWEADFKLHAPFQTTVEGHVKDGKVSGLKVIPESRMADVVTGN